MKKLSMTIIHKKEPNPSCLTAIEEKSFWLEIMGEIIDLAIENKGKQSYLSVEQCNENALFVKDEVKCDALLDEKNRA